jgi:5-methylcytosine-specific restriction endonuclease McrBC regulatory subunit McrC
MEPLALKDNQYGDQARDISEQDEGIKTLLSNYAGKNLKEWADLGVMVLGDTAAEDESHKLEFFSLNPEGSKINTHNCMGVVRLRDEKGNSVQVEIGSRFDNGGKQFFLSYLLSKVFGGSIVGDVDLGRDSLWDMLLAFVFRHRLEEASAKGLFRKYQTFNHNDTRVRGRIDVNEHLRRNIPFSGKVAYSTREITFDNPTNHLIRHAMAKLSNKWNGLFSGSGLLDMRHQLEQLTPTWQKGGVFACIRNKENLTQIKHPFFHSVYEPLRQLSLAVLRDEGASLYQQNQEAEGVIFDGSWLWEEYLWTLLKPEGFEHPENKKRQDVWKPLINTEVQFYPDFFHRKGRVIFDAKYKRSSVSSDDARQVFAYMFLLDAVHGGLIKPDEPTQLKKEIARKKITERGNTPSAWWHDISLAPPDKTDSGLFVKEMKSKEESFQECVRQILTMTEVKD